MVISSPTNFEHTLHVRLDLANGEFIGMPEEWKQTLQNSSITLNERLQNPQAVIDALDFYHYQQNKNSLSKYMYSSEKNVSVTPPRNTYVNNQKSISQNQANLTNSSSEASSIQGKSDEELDKTNYTALSTNNTSINQNEINVSLLKSYSNNSNNIQNHFSSNLTSNYSSTPNPMNGNSLAQIGLQSSLKTSSTSPTIQNLQSSGNHSNGSNGVPTSNSINMALYQYDYHTKAAKFANQNSNFNNLFATESSPQHIKQQQQQPLPPAGPPPNSRPEKTKSVLTTPVEIDQIEQMLKNNNKPNAAIPSLTGHLQQIQIKSGNGELQQQQNQMQIQMQAPQLKPNDIQLSGNGVQLKKKKMSDDEVYKRLRTIVTIGDPNRKYTKFEKIGQGASGVVHDRTMPCDVCFTVVKDIPSTDCRNCHVRPDTTRASQPRSGRGLI